jgi:stress response protein YsnF
MTRRTTTAAVVDDAEPDITVRDDLVVIPVVAEEVRVDTEVREIGRVKIAKTVELRDEPIDLEFIRDHVAVERVEVGRPVDAPQPVRYEGDIMVIPVHEEVLVVQKQLVVREELRVRIDRLASREQTSVRLRSEAVSITHSDPKKESLS